MSPEECGARLVAEDDTSTTDTVPDGCYGGAVDFGDQAYPTSTGDKYDTQYFHFFSAEELYFCTTTTDSKGDTVTTALTERPKDAGSYSLCINEYGSQNFRNGVNMYRKLTGYPDAALDKWVKVPDNDQTNFYSGEPGYIHYNNDPGDISGIRFSKPWIMFQNPVTATLTGTSAVTFAKDGVASIDVGKYTLSLAVGSYNQIFAKMMPEPTGTLASSLTLVDGDLELTGTGTDITSAGDPGSIGTMTVGTATDATANKRYTVQLSAQGQKHLTDYLQKVYARHDGQTPGSSVPANYRISSSITTATLDVLAAASLVYDQNVPAGHTAAEVTGSISPVSVLAGGTTTVTGKTYTLRVIRSPAGTARLTGQERHIGRDPPSPSSHRRQPSMRSGRRTPTRSSITPTILTTRHSRPTR